MIENENKKNISRHILPTSSNLLGLCFVILTFTRLSRIVHESIIDETMGVVIMLFLISSVFSYVSMRSKKKSEAYEKYADLLFLFALFILTLVSLVIIFEVI